ncbi:hypothetical protein EJ02DRAFT_459519 [Clathrospora elynae]|uniref:Uncharacterized protein n=1 Tax=Clathrospora elynae TaxID=706981 RepID=A0A6A5SAB3_9PLEO|nr:hypothetical protein EJ02DRAFT_459519 [Clathrospora elynae]
MKFDSSVILASLAACAVAAPAPYPGVAKRWAVRLHLFFSSPAQSHFISQFTRLYLSHLC